MSKEQLEMPEPRATIRDGDAVVEFTHGGEVVGQFNFSKVLRGWWGSIKAQHEKKGLEVVR